MATVAQMVMEIKRPKIKAQVQINLLEILQLRLKMAMTILHGKTGWK
jgi:hypothetical protein